MEIAYIVEEVDFAFWEEKGCCDGVDGGIAPALLKSGYADKGYWGVGGWGVTS